MEENATGIAIVIEREIAYAIAQNGGEIMSKELLQQFGGTAPPEWLSTHPSDQTRIADIKKLLPEALQYCKK